MADQAIVIVGGGRAAASLVESYREAGGEELVTIVSDDPQPPYNRPPLSKGFLRGEVEADAAFALPAIFYDVHVVELRHDPGSRRSTRHGVSPGADHPAVHAFRTLADASAVRDLAADARKALVVVGSFIGSEVAASLRLRGLEVTDPIAGRRKRIEHWSNADAQGAHLVRLFAGARAAYAEVPVFFTQLFGLKLQVQRLLGAVLAGQNADVAEEIKTLLRDGAAASDRGLLANETVRPTAAFA